MHHAACCLDNLAAITWIRSILRVQHDTSDIKLVCCHRLVLALRDYTLVGMGVLIAGAEVQG